MTAPTKQSVTPATADDEISLYDLWQTLVAGWRWIVGGIVVGGIAAVGYLAVTPPQYEAMALIQIGQLWQSGQSGQSGQNGQSGQSGQSGPMPVEAPARVVERVMFPTFKGAMVKKLGWDGINDVRGAVYANSLKANIAKGTDLIDLRVRGLTREEALSSLNATVGHLAVLHKALAQPMMESLQAELTEIAAEARESGKVLADLERTAQLQRQLAPRDRFSESILYAQLAATNEDRAKELRRREAQYREWISQTGKAATTAFTEPSVSNAPVSPKKLEILMFATLGGLFLGVATVMLRRGWQDQRSARNQLTDD